MFIYKFLDFYKLLEDIKNVEVFTIWNYLNKQMEAIQNVNYDIVLLLIL